MLKSIKSLFSSKKPLEVINGIYLGNERYLRVVQQPVNRPAFVSGISGVATNFQMASRYGTIGLIAHNYLSGRYFLEAKEGDIIHVLDGYGRSRPYRVTTIRKFQALDPRNPRSNFLDLDTQKTSSASEVFKEIYTGKPHLVLQTCIARGHIHEWGRQFVIAEYVKP